MASFVTLLIARTAKIAYADTRRTDVQTHTHTRHLLRMRATWSHVIKYVTTVQTVPGVISQETVRRSGTVMHAFVASESILADMYCHYFPLFVRQWLDAALVVKSALGPFRWQSLSSLSFPLQEPSTMWHRGRGRGALGSYPLLSARCGAAAATAASAGERERRTWTGSAWETLMDVRVKEVMDPGSFWAQIDQGRGSRSERCLACSL